MLIDLDYGEAAMGLAFTKLLQGKLPNHGAIYPKIREAALWIYDNALSDEEREEVRTEGLLEPRP